MMERRGFLRAVALGVVGAGFGVKAAAPVDPVYVMGWDPAVGKSESVVFARVYGRPVVVSEYAPETWTPVKHGLPIQW